jgi:hypothetical protein
VIASLVIDGVQRYQLSGRAQVLVPLRVYFQDYDGSILQSDPTSDTFHFTWVVEAALMPAVDAPWMNEAEWRTTLDSVMVTQAKFAMAAIVKGHPAPPQWESAAFTKVKGHYPMTSLYARGAVSGMTKFEGKNNPGVFVTALSQTFKDMLSVLHQYVRPYWVGEQEWIGGDLHWTFPFKGAMAPINMTDVSAQVAKVYAPVVAEQLHYQSVLLKKLGGG